MKKRRQIVKKMSDDSHQMRGVFSRFHQGEKREAKKSSFAKRLIRQITKHLGGKLPSHDIGMEQIHQTPIDEGKTLENHAIEKVIGEKLMENLPAVLKLPVDLSTLSNELSIQLSRELKREESVQIPVENLFLVLQSHFQHLLPHPVAGEKHRYNWYDKLIIRFTLESLAKHPLLSQEALMKRVFSRLTRLKGYASLRSTPLLETAVCATYADKMRPHLQLLHQITQKQFASTEHFMRRQIRTHILTHREPGSYSHLLRRILLMAKLSAKMKRDKAEEQLALAIKYVLSLSTDQFCQDMPTLHPHIYDFIQSELAEVKERHLATPLDRILERLLSMFDEVENLPSLPMHLIDDLEIIYWSILAEEIPVFSSRRMRKILDEELSYLYVDHHHQSFPEIVRLSMGYLKKLHQTDCPKVLNGHPMTYPIHSIPFKVYFWTSQHDLICSTLSFDNNYPLLKLTEKVCGRGPLNSNHLQYIPEILRTYLRKHPNLEPYREKVEARLYLLMKHLSYTHPKAELSHFDSWLLWHRCHAERDSSLMNALVLLRGAISRNLDAVAIEA